MLVSTGSGSVADSGLGIRDGKSRIRDKHPGSATMSTNNCSRREKNEIIGNLFCKTFSLTDFECNFCTCLTSGSAFRIGIWELGKMRILIRNPVSKVPEKYRDTVVVTVMYTCAIHTACVDLCRYAIIRSCNWTTVFCLAKRSTILNSTGTVLSNLQAFSLKGSRLMLTIRVFGRKNIPTGKL
jgi:hypothetical protein